VLVIRVLYRLRSLSEQGPFDAATFSYVFPLLSQILLTGGTLGEEEDDPLEQVALALEIIKFHCGECMLPSLLLHVFTQWKNTVASSGFPRLQTIEDLAHIIRSQPNLGKEASSTLIGLSEAISANASAGEIAALLRGTLSQESYVRNSCLQAIQVQSFLFIGSAADFTTAI